MLHVLVLDTAILDESAKMEQRMLASQRSVEAEPVGDLRCLVLNVHLLSELCGEALALLSLMLLSTQVGLLVLLCL